MIRLRPMGEADIFSVMEIMEENGDTSRFMAQERFLEKIKNPVNCNINNFVIELSDILIGAIGYSRKTDHYLLTWFHISKDQQGKGYGSTALKLIENEISKNNLDIMRVNTGYKRAVHFYQKNSYKIKEIVPNYYPDGNTKIILEKRI